MDLRRIEEGLIAEIITFDGEVFDWFRPGRVPTGSVRHYRCRQTARGEEPASAA